jgi:hypothetical protein
MQRRRNALGKRCRKDNWKLTYTDNTRKATSTGVKNWRKYCEEFGYNPYITFGRSRDEKVEMTEALIGWIQWNTERRRERGKNDAVGEEGRAGAEAMRERIILAINRIKSDAAHAATSVVI